MSPAEKETVYISAAIATVIAMFVALWGLRRKRKDASVPTSAGPTVLLTPEQSAAIVCEALSHKAREHADALAARDAQLGCKEKEIAELITVVEGLRAAEIASRERKAEAEKKLQQGNIEAADAIFAELEEAEAAKTVEHKHAAAEAAKHRGAIAYLNNPQAALVHYRRAAGIRPGGRGCLESDWGLKASDRGIGGGGSDLAARTSTGRSLTGQRNNRHCPW